MFKRIRKIYELSKKLESFEPYETNSSGDRLIRLHVNDLDYFLSPLSVDGVPVISDETAYLLNFYLKNMSIDGDEKLCFEVTAPDITENEQSIAAANSAAAALCNRFIVFPPWYMGLADRNCFTPCTIIISF